MNVIQEHEGYNWKTDDSAGLYLAHTGHKEAPQELPVQNIGHYAEVRTGTIQIADLEFMGAGLFGEGRGSAAHGSKWTGDCYKFGVYKLPKRKRGAIVIIRTDGSGTHVYLNDDITALETWEHLVKVSTPEMLWNICYVVVFSYEQGRNHTRREVHQQFVQGRLKKVRRNRQVYVEVKA